MDENIGDIWAARIEPRIRANIARVGCHLVGVFPDDREAPGLPFIYSIGGYQAGRPELLLLGGVGERFAALVNAAFALRPVQAGLLDIGGKFPLMAVEADSRAYDYTCQVGAYYGIAETDYRVLQLVVCDLQGRFPWDAGCAHPYRAVPVLRASLH